MATIFVLNLGSTSTKAAVFDNQTLVKETTIRYQPEDLNQFTHLYQQQDLRNQDILNWAKKENIDLPHVDVIVVRGGVVKPLPGGIYQVDEDVIKDVKEMTYGLHASNVGLLIGYQWQRDFNVPVIFVDAPCTDEFSLLARYSGIKGYNRRSLFHALNQKQVARRYGESIQKDVSELRLIVVHAGGGVSVGAHRYGQVVDVNNALDGEGPFTPQRTGGISTEIAFNILKEHDFDIEKVKTMLVNQGGLVSYTGSFDMIEILKKADSDPEIKRVVEAMIYQIAKEVGAMATVLKGRVDQILFTGGLMYNSTLVKLLTERVSFIAPITLYPGEDELLAMALGGLRYLKNPSECQSYR